MESGALRAVQTEQGKLICCLYVSILLCARFDALEFWSVRVFTAKISVKAAWNRVVMKPFYHYSFSSRVTIAHVVLSHVSQFTERVM